MVIVARVKSILPRIGSATQREPLLQVGLSQNILVSYEIVHSMFNQNIHNGSMVIKLDMSN